MPLFLLRVPFLLPFLGRSTGLSVASIRAVSSCTSLCINAFSPGKENVPSWINVSSTQRLIRIAVVSCTPKSCAMWKYVRYSRKYSKARSNLSSMLSLLLCPPFRRFCRYLLYDGIHGGPLLSCCFVATYGYSSTSFRSMGISIEFEICYNTYSIQKWEVRLWSGGI